MAFASPETLRKIFGGMPIAQAGAFDPTTPQGQTMINTLAGTGAGMSQAAAQPGADFGQALGGGAAGMMQGQQHNQQQQMGQLQMQQMRQQMQQAQADMERRERMQKILGDMLGGGQRQDWASQVDAQPRIGAQAQPMAPQGQISARYESGGNPMAVSSGRGDPGGVSYGTHQMSTDAGTMQAFLESPEGQPFAQHFSGQQPGSPQFSQSFQEVQAGAGPQFEQAQQAFLQRTHVQPVMEQARKAGLPVDNPGIQQALHSQAIQHSGEGNLQIINEAVAKAGPNATPDQFVDALYDSRERYAMGALQRNGASPDVIEGVRNRYRSERQAVREQLGTTRTVQQGQAGPLAQQPQQAPQNGYQQPQRQGGAIPPQAAQLLSLMEPEQAVKALWDMQTKSQAELPAAVREMLFAFNGDEQAASAAMRQKIEREGQEGGPTTSTQTKEQQVAALIANDPTADPQAIRNMVYGRYVVSRDPISGKADVIDVTTGQPVRNVNPADVDRTNGANADEELFSTIVPEGMDISPGMGGSGWLANIINTSTGAVGMEPLFPDAETAIQAMDNLKTQTMTALAQEVAGRPSNYLLEQFERIAPSPANLLQGDSRSREKLRTTSALIDEKLRMVNDVVNNPDQYRPITVDQARQNKLQLEALKRQYDTAYENFGSGGRGQQRPGGSQGPLAQPPADLPPAPEGVPEDAWQFMTDEERALWQN